jgi:tRNA(Ser,Leu) C12 N-acetylase TAN1
VPDETSHRQQRPVHKLVLSRDDKGPITLDELAVFVQECLRAEIPGNSTFVARTKGFGMRLSSIESAPPRV